MAINSNVLRNYQTAEYGKFVELVDNSNFPPVSVIRWSYPDTSSAFPGNSAALPLSSVDIYPKYAVLTHLANASDISISLSANELNVNLGDVENLLKSQLGQSGFVFVEPSDGVVPGTFTTIQVISACKIASIVATNSDTSGIINYELPVNFSFNGPITSISLTYGAVIAYKL